MTTNKVLTSNEGGVEVEEHTMTDGSFAYNVNIRTDSDHLITIACSSMEEAEVLAKFLRDAVWIDVI